MEELIERVSDIAKSPVIRKIWHLLYRQVFRFSLVISLVFILFAADAQDSKVSRYSFLSAVFERVYNRKITEIEAVNSGLMDLFDDGSYHLDWPVSRGMAATTLYRLAIQGGNAAKLPRAFSDINGDSSFNRPLQTVGGAFLPLKKGRFDPNYLLDRQTIFHALKVLLENGVLKQEDRADMQVVKMYDPIETASATVTAIEDTLNSIKPELGFKEQQSSDGLYKAATYKRLANAEPRVTAGQIDPQMMSSIEDAGAAMADVEGILTRLGGSVMEMTETYPSNPDDETVLRQGLAQIENVLSAVLNRFEYSKQQLSTVMPVDPDQVKKCDELNSKLVTHIAQVGVLKKRIALRLAEPAKETGNAK